MKAFHLSALPLMLVFTTVLVLHDLWNFLDLDGTTSTTITTGLHAGRGAFSTSRGPPLFLTAASALQLQTRAAWMNARPVHASSSDADVPLLAPEINASDGDEVELRAVLPPLVVSRRKSPSPARIAT